MGGAPQPGDNVMATRKHLTVEELAALVDGGLDAAAADEAREHLAECRLCMTAYSEAVQYRSLWLEDAAAFAPSEDAMRLGRKVTDRERTVPRHRRSPARLRPVMVSLSAAAAGLAVILLISQPVFGPQSPLDEATLAPLRQAIGQASASGLVIPAGDIISRDALPTYRAGIADADTELAEAIVRLSNAYDDGDRSPEITYWLAASRLATGQLGSARAYLSEARLRFPDDDRLTTLEAVIAYRESDLERAEQLLQGVVARDGGNFEAVFNLGVVLRDRGRADQARAMLERLPSDSPLSARAQAILAQMD